MSQKISKLGLKQILFICIATIICVATLGLGVGLGVGAGSRNETPAEALQNENRVLPRGITQVSAGGSHTVAIDSQGNLWAVGGNDYGQLGNMSTANINSTPINITAQAGNPLNGKQIIQVSAGFTHTMAIDSQGNLWTFGLNNSGQLGNRTTTTSSTPINITAQPGNPLNGKQIVSVSAGEVHAMAIDSQGNLWVFGHNNYGQLGNMTTSGTNPNSTPINITAQSGNPLNGKKIVQVSTGMSHTTAIDSQGSLWAFGYNEYGRLGNRSTTNSSTPINITAQSGNPLNGKQIIQVSAGSSHTTVIDSQGSLWAFGFNYSGQLGNMTTSGFNANSSPISITTQAGNPLNGKQIVQVSAGSSYTMAIDSLGNLWAFGNNNYGQLGNMSTTSSSTPINITSQSGNPLNGKQIVQVSVVGDSHILAIDSTGNLWAFGLNSQGQLGNMSTDNSSTPINITAQPGNPLNSSQFGRMQVSAGGYHTVVIDAACNLWAFGYNYVGQLGNMSTNDSSTPVNITAQPGNPLYGKHIVQVATGNHHTMAIDASGNLWSFGYNYSGQLGNMTTSEYSANSTPINITAQPGNPLYGKHIVQVSAGGSHTMAIDASGNLWSFGYGSYGQLGNMSTTETNSTPICITTQSGNPLNGKQIVQVSAGGYHATALDASGNLWTFGYGAEGQVGNMSINYINSTPINITAQAGNPLNGKQIVQVSAGSGQTMALDSVGVLWAFGRGLEGQLGNMSINWNNSTPINISAQAGNPLNGKQIIQVSAGGDHTVVIDSQGNLWAFGRNDAGALGNMSTTDSSTPINITGSHHTTSNPSGVDNPLLNKQVVQISAGMHTTAIDSQGKVWAFGYNYYGQLGNMSTDDSSTPINISTIASTSATIAGNPQARISVRTNFTTGWGELTASGGTYTGWTANTLSSPTVTKNDSTQTGRVRYEFDAGNYNTVSELYINGELVGISTFSDLALYYDIFYLRVLITNSRLIVEIDRINTKLFVPITISAVTTRNVGHKFNFSSNSHISSRMKVTPGSGAETTSLTHIYNDLVWNGNTANITTSAVFTFTSQAAFTKIIISRPSQADVTITDFTNPFISVAGLAGTLIHTPGSINTMTIILNSMEQYEYTWTIETQQIIQVQQILNPPAGATSVVNPALLTLNSSSGANWADTAFASPGNLFGKTFAGWYTHPDYTKGTLITTVEQFQQHITATGGAIVFLYARWN